MALRNLRNNLTSTYPFGGPTRVVIQDSKIEWTLPWPEYSPPDFTTKAILKGVTWADAQLPVKWNQEDGAVNRKSHHGNYLIDAEGYPLNPAGRTGLKGRGRLGRWATNHAADCIITRFKKKDEIVCMLEGKPQLQFIGIIRGDTGEAAFPGGFIELGEDGMVAAKREFLEEVFSFDDLAEEERCKLEDELKNVFSKGEMVYEGYVDDHRNTDNAWIETQAVNFSLDGLAADVFKNLKFKAGSDANEAMWIDVDQNVNLYASHKSIKKKTC